MGVSGKPVVATFVLVGFALASIALAAERDDRRKARQANSPTHTVAPGELGPEMVAYLEFLDSEAAELKYYLDGHEMPAADYRIAKDKLDIAREFAIRLVKKRGLDVVPELYVLREGELTQIIPEGVASLKGKRAGEELDAVWTFHGTSRRSDLFYVLERTDSIRRAPGP